MKTHLELTPKLTDTMRQAVKAQFDTNTPSVGASVFWAGKNKPKVFPREACYAPTAQRLLGRSYWDDTPFENKYDSFGLICQGWSGHPLRQGWGPEACMWLGALMEPEGPFKNILPHIANKDTVVEDGGFVFHNLQDVNLGSLWTFAQATRMMYEHPSRMSVFLYAKEKYGLRMGAFIAMNLAPDTASSHGLWRKAICAHGEPLALEGTRVAGRYLTATPRDTLATTTTAGSHACFLPKNETPMPYGPPGPPKPLEAFVDEYNKEQEKFSGTNTAAAA